MKERIPYHKGNLAEKLVREAARIIGEDGLKHLSMRKLSDRLGISRTAAYHHFKNKDDLLSAVARTGFKELLGRLQAATQSDSGLSAMERLQAAVLAYVTFADDETEFFRLMFGNVVERPLRVPEDRSELSSFSFSSEESLRTYRELIDLITLCQEEAGLQDVDTSILASTVWAYMHGLAHLWIGNQLKISCSLSDFVDQSTGIFLAGFLNKKAN